MPKYTFDQIRDGAEQDGGSTWAEAITTADNAVRNTAWGN